MLCTQEFRAQNYLIHSEDKCICTPNPEKTRDANTSTFWQAKSAFKRACSNKRHLVSLRKLVCLNFDILDIVGGFS